MLMRQKLNCKQLKIRLLVTGTMTKSMLRGGVHYLQRFDCTMRFKQIVIKAIEMFGMLTVSGLYHYCVSCNQ